MDSVAAKSTPVSSLNNPFELKWKDFASKYVVNSEYGICIDKAELPKQFHAWEKICKNLYKHNASGKTRSLIEDLELISTDCLKDYDQLLAAVAYLLMMTNAYLYCDMEDVAQVLPKQLAIPLYQVCERLGCKNSFGYIQQIFNWERKNPAESHKIYDNLRLRYSFTGTIDEETFFLISTFSDFQMATIFKAMYEANQNLAKEDDDAVLKNLQDIKTSFDNIIDHMGIMRQQNRPMVYYNQLRPYLAGYSDKKYLPNGVLFEGVTDENGKPYTSEAAGGSVGNDPSYQIFEAGIGIHFEGEMAKFEDVFAKAFMQPHRDLIKDMKAHSKIREYIKGKQNPGLTEAYNDIISKYIKFYLTHWGYIQTFIVQVAKKPEMEVVGKGDTPLSVVRKKPFELQNFKL